VCACLGGGGGGRVHSALSALPLWDRLSLEPYSGPKHATAVLVLPASDDALVAGQAYLRNLSAVYEVSHGGASLIVRPCFAHTGNPR
jgi:hypothetical protein